MNNYLLWESDELEIVTPKNPHISLSEGQHFVVLTKNEIPNAWSDPELSAKAFLLATQLCRILEANKIAPWFNIQANGNWGLLPGTTPRFHVHVYTRLKTGKTWGQPVQLPLQPKTYNNEPLPESARHKISEMLDKNLC